MNTPTPLSHALLREIVSGNPLHRSFLEAAQGELTGDERVTLETYLRFCVDTGHSIESIALSYNTVVLDVLREQAYFQRHDRYRYSTYDEVAGDVYDNPDYMGRYMHGVAVTQFLWPNHLAMRRFFIETLPKAATGRYLEVGPGHGLFMMTAMQLGSFGSFLGVDVSATSIAQTRAVLEHPLYGPMRSYELEHCDFLQSTVDEPVDALVMGEVLEHVEDPARFLRKARATTRADTGYFFMTTAVNGAVIDHIYLFRTVAEVDELVAQCGFTVRRRLVVPHAGTTLEESEERRLPISVAYALA